MTKNFPTLLLKAARTGILDVWMIVAEAVEALGQEPLEEVSNIEANTGRTNPGFLR